MEVQQQMLGGRYKLLNELGSGGMAVVWRARDEVLGRTVAVKLLAGRYANDPLSRSRIRDEARAAATLSPHPNIAQVYDFGESIEAGTLLPYVVMELVNGPTLQERVASGPLAPSTVFRICGEVASALAAAHADGLVHRDIKPANVMVTTAGAKVVDFGLAAAAGPGEPEEVLLGTPAYLAPERLTGASVEPATDVYALGVLLYRLLANTSPWTVDTTTQMLSAHIYVEPAPMPQLPGVPPEVTDLVHRCLRKRPSERPSAAEASALLAEAARATPASVPAQHSSVGFAEPTDHVNRTDAASSAPSGNVPAPVSKPPSRREQALERLAAAHAEAAAVAPLLVSAGSAPDVQAPGVEAPGVEAPGVEAPGVEAPGVQAPALRAAAAPARIPAPRAAAGERPPRNSEGPDGSATEGSGKAAGVPDRGKRKRRALLAGGGLVTAVVAVLVGWQFAPFQADGPREAAAAPPGSAARQPSGAVNLPGVTRTAIKATHAGAGVNAGVVPPPARRSAAGAPDPGAGGNAGPTAAPTTTSAPSQSPPAIDGQTTTLSSAGGTVDARCVGRKALLAGWQPTDPYKVQRVNAGPVVAAAIVFKHKSSKIRMTVTCVAGVPTSVNLPL